MQREQRDDYDVTTDVTTTDYFTPGIATVGVFDHRLFATVLRPLLEDLRRTSTAAGALVRLEAWVNTDVPLPRRDDLIAQLDRMRGSGSSEQPSWKLEAAGLFIEHACLEETTDIRDLNLLFRSALPLLTPWSIRHARTLLEFFREQNEQTIRWASGSDVWRTSLPNESLVPVAEAMSALSPHELERLLREAEGGSIFTPEEAAELREWWNSLRRMVRLAARSDRGLFVSVRRS
jgi:hypothetical protein